MLIVYIDGRENRSGSTRQVACTAGTISMGAKMEVTVNEM